MRVVADASLLVATLVDSGHDGRWARSRIAVDAIAGPELALAEASNTLRRMELARQITPSEATRAQRDLIQLPLTLFPFTPYAERVWALRGALTIYDAWYVALAEALDCPLLTLDRRLSRASGPACEVITPPAAPRVTCYVALYLGRRGEGNRAPGGGVSPPRRAIADGTGQYRHPARHPAAPRRGNADRSRRPPDHCEPLSRRERLVLVLGGVRGRGRPS